MRQVINRINEIDFNLSETGIFSGISTSRYCADLQSAGNAGEYYTPRAITQFMVDMVDRSLERRYLTLHAEQEVPDLRH